MWEETENLGYVESTGSACNAAGHPVTVPLDLCTGIGRRNNMPSPPTLERDHF